MAPFVVFALPRSRTFWLSKFLSFGGWHCGHEEIRYARDVGDIKTWLSMPRTGTVETAAAPFWRTLRDLAPDARVVTLRRDRADVIMSMMRLGIPFDLAQLTSAARRWDAKLDQIEQRWPGALSVRFDDLQREEICASLFEHCTGSIPPPGYWEKVAPLNLQIDMPALMRYMNAYEPQLTKLARAARHRSVANMAAGRSEIDGITLQQERINPFWGDALPLFEEHLVQTGQSPDDHLRKNFAMFKALDEIGALQIITARSNGRMFGYLLSVVAPSLDSPDKIEAWHTIFFASPEVRGLGMKLQRAAIVALRERGIGDVIMKAGHRGSGPRLGTFYRRLGAEPFGELYRLELE